jgi:putative membrane-bound dehydrogenase-like protein
MSILRPAAVFVCCVACGLQAQTDENALGGLTPPSSPEHLAIPIGAAVVDISPDYPVRLTGYGNRTKESEGVAAKIHARALVIGGNESGKRKTESSESQLLPTFHSPLSTLITVDNCGVPLELTEAVFARVAAKHGITRERFAISSTHSHAAPWLRGFAPNILSTVTDDQAARLAQYETELIEQLVEVVDQAIAARRSGYLSYGFGEAGFAMNRRVLADGRWTDFGETPDGPTDKRVPVLAAHDTDGNLIAVLANYACHCTTETGDFNQISGDWAGFAADMLEADHPGAVALIAIGCGADANPSPRGTHEQARAHGRTMADEVNRVLNVAVTLRRDEPSATPRASGTLSPDAEAPEESKVAFSDGSDNQKAHHAKRNGDRHRIDPRITCNMTRIDLPLGPLPSREDWEKQAKETGIAGLHARYFLKLLDEGKEIPTTIPNYPVQTWCFGDDLAMVFLGGEVVVDYSLRMNDMFDGDRLWINAYSNDVPCYIASARLLREGGYECDSSMLYYRRPTRLAPEAEDVLCDAVQKLMPHEFYSEKLQQDFPAPKSPEDSLKCMTTKPDLRIVLAASEPLIHDPVAFDWDERGRLWVVEMGDYPQGKSGTLAAESGESQVADDPAFGSPLSAFGSGRVQILEDTDTDGVYDKATTFLDGLAFPNGIQCWRGGVIVTMAPEIFYAEDADGDGAADVRKTLFKGFTEGNQQHRVNGLRWGLDGWLYLANGDSGGEIAGTGVRWESGKWTAESGESQTTGDSALHSPVSLRGRDLRIHPDTNGLDTVSGQTQFGRERDDFGNWFGNNNSNPIYQYVLEDRYVRRNPHAGISQVTAQVSEIPGAAPVYPASRTLARFNEFGSVNRFTSACSTMIYRDNFLGEQFYGNAFTSEPVHNLVSRLVMTRDGYRFKGERAADEQESEFLASSDNWFRPTMIRTGPDGALWIADMYRAVIEHPEWIPPEYQRKMNLYAGNDRGRIWRIVPVNECCSENVPVTLRRDEPAGTPVEKAESRKREADRVSTGEVALADAEEQQKAHHAERDGYFDQPWNEIPIADLVKRLKSPNGWWRDTAQRILLHRSDEAIGNGATCGPLHLLLFDKKRPAIQLQAAATIAGIFMKDETIEANPTTVIATLFQRKPTPGFIAGVLRSLEPTFGNAEADFQDKIRHLIDDEDSAVRLQLILSLGEFNADSGATLLGKMLHENFDDHYLRSAGFTSLTPDNIGGVLNEIMGVPADDLNEELLGILLAQAAAMGKGDQLADPLKQLVATIHADSPATRLDVVGNTLNRMIDGAGGVIRNDAAFIAVLRSALDAAIISARNESHDEDQRSAAIRFADIAEQFTGDASLNTSEFFTPQTPQSIQITAANIAAQRANDNTFGQLLSHWNSFPPSVRSKVIATFLSRETTTKQALEAVESGQISMTDFDATQRDGLLNHRNDEIRVMAKKLFGEETPSARSAVVEDFRSQISNLKSDAVAGRAVFEKRCSTCHRLQDVGKEVGADLAALKDRSTDAMLTAILDPNRAVESKFLVYTVVTKDGLQHVGMLKGETGGSLTLIGNDGKEQTVVRADIEEFVASKRSLMPEGLEKDLSGQDLANVIAFVQSAGTPWKRFEGNTPQFVTASADGTITLPASAAEIYGPSLVFEQQYGNLGYWESTEDYAKWTFEVPTSGHWVVEFDFACDDGAAGSLIKFSTSGRMLTARVPGSGTWDRYQRWQAGTIDLHRGRGQLTITTPEKPPMGLIDLRAIRLIPPK